MKKLKTRADISLLEAVDNLSSLAELDHQETAQPEEPVEALPEEIVPVMIAEQHKVEWKDPTHKEENKEIVKETFRVLRNYLQHVYDKEPEHLQELETQKGLRAIMVLAGEAAQKVDRFTSLFKSAYESESVTQLEEYKELQHFYMTKILKKFQESLESEENWQAEWGMVEEETIDFQRRGLKDIETVKRDKEYELFMMRKEDGRPFYNQNLIRHIKLVGDFDETVNEVEGEESLLRFKNVVDRASHASSQEILRLATPYLEDFFKEALKHKDSLLVSNLNKAVMALLLTANPRNLLQNAAGKSCMRYFSDFHYFLREALSTEEYGRFISFIPKEDQQFFQVVMQLIHALSGFFFMHSGTRKEGIELIYRLIQKSGKKSVPASGGDLSLWTTLLDEDEQIRAFLKRYPSGPLLKTLEVLREGAEGRYFDPLGQQNYPSQLFNFSYDGVHVSCLRMPSPTRQEYVNKGKVAEDFLAFLRFLRTQEEGERHLLINLQDRTNWQEHTRSVLVEGLQTEGEFGKNLSVVTLPKNTEFYLQTGPYETLNQADHFIEQFKEQIASGEQCGFYFPSELNPKSYLDFAEQAMRLVHQYFFSQKNVFSRKERLDFIEVFYQFFILKLVDLLRPDTMSLTCKDAVDVGAAANATFFCFNRMLSKHEAWSQEEKDFILWLLYSPALMIRERAIDVQRLHRSISALALINAELAREKGPLLEAMEKLYGKTIFSQMQIQPAA